METKGRGKSENRSWGHSHNSSQKVMTGAPFQVSVHKRYRMGSKDKTGVGAQLYGCSVIKIRECGSTTRGLVCCTESDWDRVNFLPKSLSGGMFWICD